ncbi:MAG TPA: STM3941 family protein [Mobilitalea sp.]|nr:STM3941 family protein [Mobilitalea sp.]
MGEIVIEETNYKAFALALANLFILLASIAITIFGFKEAKARFWLPGMLASFIFLIGFVRAVIKAADIRKLLTITTDGVIDNSRIGGFGFISYDNIKGFRIISLYNAKAIVIIPKNVDSFLSKLSPVKRRIVKRNIRLNLPAIAINVHNAKDMEPEDILTLLEKRLSDYSRLYE